MLAEQALLAAIEAAEDIGRAELQGLRGDTAMSTSVVDGVECRRVETGSKPWRTERVVVRGQPSVEMAGLRRRRRGQLGQSSGRRVRAVRRKSRTLKFKNRLLTIVQTTTFTAQKVGSDLEVPH
jgi:hypothetical protein